MWRCVYLFMLFMTALAAAPAAASGAPTIAGFCRLASEVPASLSEARESLHWDCESPRTVPPGRHDWARLALPRPTDLETLRLESSAVAYGGLAVGIVFEDGGTATRTFSSGELASHYAPGTHFSLPLDFAGSRKASAIYVRIDDPLDQQVASGLRLRGEAQANRIARETFTVMGALVGAMSILAVIGIALAVMVRERFAFYHSGFTIFLIVYIMASSSMIFMIAPEIGLWARTVTSYASLALAIAMLVPFLIAFVEKDALPGWMRTALHGAAASCVLAAVVLPLGAGLFDIYPRQVYHALFLPVLLFSCLSVVIGLYRGSAAMQVLAIAWSMPIVFAFERVLRGFGLYTLPPWGDFMFFGAMALEAVGMTVAVIWKMSLLRRDRDRARLQAREAANEALRDALTGLENRRAFDRMSWEEDDYLAILDLDRFKGINDRHGHDVGDAVLQAVGKTLARACENGQALEAWRLGGEEFALRLRAGSIEEAAIAANRVRYAIGQDLAGRFPMIQPAPTASTGLAAIEGDLARSYHAADTALYRAKAGGRDRLSFESDRGSSQTIFPRRREERPSSADRGNPRIRSA